MEIHPVFSFGRHTFEADDIKLQLLVSTAKMEFHDLSGERFAPIWLLMVKGL